MITKKTQSKIDWVNKYGSYLLFQGKTQVPSAMWGLTALFGMGRGEHPRNNHHKKILLFDIIIK